MMIWIAVGMVGLMLGLVLTIWTTDRLMKKPATRIWLSDWVNWSNNKLPEGSFQMVRHGKWIAARKEDETT